MAAYSISESLALALAESRVLDRKEVIGLLQDAAAAHHEAPADAAGYDRHRTAARLIERVISGVQSVGHSNAQAHR